MTTLDDTSSPMEAFKERLEAFATQKRRGIRNPFVIVPIDPALERKVSTHLREWADASDGDIPIDTVDLEEAMVDTEVFETASSVSRADWRRRREATRSEADAYAESVTQTMRDNLTDELVASLVDKRSTLRETHEQILLLLNLGSLHPFARASALLDELDRQRVRATIGVPFPGRIFAGKLAFFGREARHYYPAHRIERQIDDEAYL